MPGTPTGGAGFYAFDKVCLSDYIETSACVDNFTFFVATADPN